MLKKLSPVGQFFTSWIRKSEWLLVVGLIILGAGLRFWNFPNTLDWSNDSSRDFTVAYQIVYQGQRPIQGHFNTGTNSFYPPYYYYFLAGLSLLDSSPNTIYGVFILTQVLGLLGLYVIGKLTVGRTRGLAFLLIVAFSPYLISTVYQPKPAQWVFPGSILALGWFLSWLKHRQSWQVTLSLGLLAYLSVVHSGSLALAGVILIWTLGWASRHRQLKTWLGWVGVFIAILVGLQLPFYQTPFPRGAGNFQWPLSNLVTIFHSIRMEWPTRPLNLEGFLILLGISPILVWKAKRFQAIKWWRDVPEWGWFLAFYLVTFESILAVLPTGKLSHHQLYMFPVWLLLGLGLVQYFTASFRPVWLQRIYEWGMVGLLASSLVITSANNFGQVGSYVKTQELFDQLRADHLPLTTARVLVTDSDGSRLSHASNSTEIWWFLTTQLGRRDLKAQSWAIDSEERSQLILICDENMSAFNSVTCEAQEQAVLGSQGRVNHLEEAFETSSGYHVQLYRLDPPDKQTAPQ